MVSDLQTMRQILTKWLPMNARLFGPECQTNSTATRNALSQYRIRRNTVIRTARQKIKAITVLVIALTTHPTEFLIVSGGFLRILD